MTTPVRWAYLTDRGKVVHAITGAGPGDQVTTTCGRPAWSSNLRPAEEYSNSCLRCFQKEHGRREPSVVTDLEVARLDKSRMQKMDGFVYCVTHTVVHEDTLDPYWESDATCLTQYNGSGVGVKKDDVHRAIYARWKTGDYPDA